MTTYKNACYFFFVFQLFLLESNVRMRRFLVGAHHAL